MKIKYFFSIFMLPFFFSCNKEDKMVIGDGALTKSSLQFEEAKLAIYAMNLDTTFMSEWNNYYIVEEDILICKDSINRATTRQYRANYYVDNLQTITIGVDNTISMNSEWRDIVKSALYIYNENTGLKFVYSESNPIIRITKAAIEHTNVCAAGEFPTSSRRPGSVIIINSNFFEDIDTYLSTSQKLFLLLHEIGHNIGLRHTNGGAEGSAGIGLIQIPGTPVTDSESFMNAGTCGYFWTSFSNYDKVALNYLWPKIYTVYFAVSDCHSINVESGELLDRSIVPLSANQIFSGWYEDRELTIPWSYGKQIMSNLHLYPKWRPKTPSVIYQKDSYASQQSNFTLNQTTGVTFTGRICRGFNEWWEITRYGSATVAVGRYSTLIKAIHLVQCIQTPSTAASFEYTENLVLDAGTYWLSASFPPELGPQNGASLKHGVTTATIKY